MPPGRTTSVTTLTRGEVWHVRFDPAVGADMQKTRPAVVISVDEVGILPLRIIVPIMEWQTAFANRLTPGLIRGSFASTTLTHTLDWFCSSSVTFP